jgi:hypothetical protein
VGEFSKNHRAREMTGITGTSNCNFSEIGVNAVLQNRGIILNTGQGGIQYLE